MIRTQLYLDEEVHQRLRDLADKQGRTNEYVGRLRRDTRRKRG
jgi:predicted DNA-binding protein